MTAVISNDSITCIDYVFCKTMIGINVSICTY